MSSDRFLFSSFWKTEGFVCLFFSITVRKHKRLATYYSDHSADVSFSLCLFFWALQVLFFFFCIHSSERAEASSVTPYCGPLTCKGAMWSILMSINHYHVNADKSGVRSCKRRLAALPTNRWSRSATLISLHCDWTVDWTSLSGRFTFCHFSSHIC